MIKVSVMYPNGPGATFDMDYYVNSHMPMVRKKLAPALLGMQIEQGVGGAEPGSAPTYLGLGHLIFASVESFGEAFAPHAEAILGDIPNYTNTQPVIQVSDVKL
jgi:uncharacterized protein (TIGR02118 family)